MLNLSLKELRLVAKNRGIKGYKSMSKSKLLSMINPPEPIKEKKIIKDIRKENLSIDKILRDLKPFFFEPDNEDYYEPALLITVTSNMKVMEIKTKRYQLNNMINDHQTQGKWKIKLTVAVNFLSSKDTGEMRTFHSKCDNTELKNFLNLFYKNIKKKLRTINERKRICF